jgi:hypothetical protein
MLLVAGGLFGMSPARSGGLRRASAGMICLGSSGLDIGAHRINEIKQLAYIWPVLSYAEAWELRLRIADSMFEWFDWEM